MRVENSGKETKEVSLCQCLEPTIYLLLFALRDPGFSSQVPQNKGQVHVSIPSSPYIFICGLSVIVLVLGFRNSLRLSCAASSELLLLALLETSSCQVAAE